jgi:hypothetical protein
MMTDEAEIERLAQQYAGNDFRERRRVRIEKLAERWSGEWTLDQFLTLLQKIKDEMPEDATRAKVEFDSGGGADESPSLVVSYETWEPEEETRDRVSQTLAYAHERAQAERTEYERLRAKFGT